jgi:hypothetical protein
LEVINYVSVLLVFEQQRRRQGQRSGPGLAIKENQSYNKIVGTGRNWNISIWW